MKNRWMLSGKVSAINDRMKINTSGLTSGIYLAQIDYNSVKQTIKIVKYLYDSRSNLYVMTRGKHLFDSKINLIICDRDNLVPKIKS